MHRNNKRTLTDLDLNPSPTSKRVRREEQTTPLPQPQTKEAILSPALSSPTLVGSLSTSNPSPSLQTSEVEDTSATSSGTSDSEESESDSSDSESTSTSSDESSGVSTYDGPHVPTMLPPLIQHHRSTSSTTSTAISPESITSSSASVSDDAASSISSGSSESNSSSASSSSSDSESNSGSASTSPLTLTARNLSALQQRLDSLLPRLQSAHEMLEQERMAGKLEERNIEDVRDWERKGRGYIEMDLGLGVLEARNEEGEESSEESSQEASAANEDAWSSTKVDGMAKLLGDQERKGKRKVGIEEISSR